MTDAEHPPGPDGSDPPPSRLGRVVWIPVGCCCVALGGLGAVVPGLPSTIFFIGAAAAFARSSPRLEAWLLGLPGVGRMVRNHRAGLGMPLRAKVIAVTMIVVAVGVSAVRLDHPLARVALFAAGAVGVAAVLRQPTDRTGK